MRPINLVIFPMHDWKKCEKEGFRTRDVHLIRHFEKNENVGKSIVVDRPIALPEMILKRRFWRVRDGETVKMSLFTSLLKVSEKLYVLDIFSSDLIKPLVFKRDWWDYVFRKPSVIEKIKDAISFLDLSNIVLFLWSPLSTGVLGKLGEELVAFDALDNWTRHPEMKDKRGWIKRGYKIIKKEADIIFTNSKETQKFMENPKTTPIFIPNGVNKESFYLKERKTPRDLESITRPIIGYAGKIGKRINARLISFLAQKLPQMNFVFVGQFLNKKWAENLFNLANVHFLGDKHYSQLPNYLASFDVCIIPHNFRSIKSGEDPIKLYEYLAAGKPVVTTNISGVDVFKDVITIAHNKEEFLQGINYWCKRVKEDKDLSEKLRANISEKHFWSTKADIIVNLILEKLSSQEEKIK